MKHLYSIFVLLYLFFSSNSFGQTFEKNEKKENSKDAKFNLPPGAALTAKSITSIDLSYKLDGSAAKMSYNSYDLKVAKAFSDEELESFKVNDLITYNYYTTANNFFNSLSQKIKTIYSKDELWYIYVFDQNLKNKLLTIK